MENSEKLKIRNGAQGVIISVKVVPGSSRDKIVGLLGDCLKVTTSAAPEKGKANAAVAKILAKALGVDSGSVELISGPASPRKQFHVTSISVDAVQKALREL